MNSRKALPIGVFDSGIGGLTVLRALMERLPGEKFIYVGDTARVPYGIRSKETVQRYAREIAGFLVSEGIKLLVVACNTASAVALDTLKGDLSVPVIGVIEPGARAATQRTRNHRVGVIGTETTIKSNSYVKHIKSINPEITVITKACPLFVPLVEEGWTDGPVTEMVTRKYLADVIEARIDTLVLGCTHYPLLKGVIQKVVGPGVVLIDSAEETALEVKRTLQEMSLLNNTSRAEEAVFYVTDAPERFMQIGGRFLGRGLRHINILSLEEVANEKGW